MTSFITQARFQSKIAAAMVALCWATNCFGAENPLSLTILKTERSGPDHTYLLLQAENRSEQRFDFARWSCVFWNKGEAVFEGTSSVHNVPPHDRAISREIQSYGGPFDQIECRFMQSLPSVCP
jgi:hypothetical protein